MDKPTIIESPEPMVDSAVIAQEPRRQGARTGREVPRRLTGHLVRVGRHRRVLHLPVRHHRQRPGRLVRQTVVRPPGCRGLHPGLVRRGVDTVRPHATSSLSLSIVAFTVVALSVLIGVPAAYILARRNFPFKRAIMVLFLLPILIPPITFGIPLATVLYNFGLGRSLLAVILANLVPSVPFVILTMTPFIEQINPTIENAARMCGGRHAAVFGRILAPLLVPGSWPPASWCWCARSECSS